MKTAAIDGVDPRAFCLERGIAAMGWQVETHGPVTWESYVAAAAEKHLDSRGWKRATRLLHDDMQVNHLCWTRDSSGIYYLGRITGEWAYLSTAEHQRADMVNTRPCEWLMVGPEDSVPGKVVRSFIPSSTLQRVNGESIKLVSAFMYNQRTETAHRYELDSRSSDFFSLMSADDCEDLVGAFLQHQGYIVVPSTCRLSTPTYEFILKHRDTGVKAGVQAKNGAVDLHPRDYRDFPGHMFLFTSGGTYPGEAPKNVTCITREDLVAFIERNRHCLSDQLNAWLDLSDELAKGP